MRYFSNVVLFASIDRGIYFQFTAETLAEALCLAAQEGQVKSVRVLLTAPHVDPSADAFKAVKLALQANHLEVGYRMTNSFISFCIFF
jgi:hypothetical protein